MKRTCLAAALALSAALPAAAQGPATIRGQVYACDTGRPVPRAAVHLHGLADLSTITLTAGADGRFARVGLEPGRYLIEAAAPLPTQPIRYGHWVSPTASRLARVETDDVLDLRIGTDPPARAYGIGPVGPVRRAGTIGSTTPHPACDDPLVPPAAPTVDRYIIH